MDVSQHDYITNTSRDSPPPPPILTALGSTRISCTDLRIGPLNHVHGSHENNPEGGSVYRVAYDHWADRKYLVNHLADTSTFLGLVTKLGEFRPIIK